MAVTVFSPAKINLYLAVTGRRPDGFHDLVSVVAPLDFGDELAAEARADGAGRQFSLTCDQPEVPLDDSNLILRAASAFAAATGFGGRVAFRLTKRIPLGAGLGGGSSNAVAALRALNQLAGGLLPEPRLAGLAVELGSDCALFVHSAPVIMRGRGENITRLPASAATRLRGRQVLLFKPGFGISTPWAYQRMITRGTDYVPAAEAERKLAAWLGGTAPVEELLGNNMEAAAFDKFVALPVMLGKLSAGSGVAARMSGSGSACFALPRHDCVTPPLEACIRECWGPAAFVQNARLA